MEYLMMPVILGYSSTTHWLIEAITSSPSPAALAARYASRNLSPVVELCSAKVAYHELQHSVVACFACMYLVQDKSNAHKSGKCCTNLGCSNSK